MPIIQVPSTGWSLSVTRGERLLDACEQGGLEIYASCGGFAACNSCRVRVLHGELSPIEEAEEPFLDRPDHRLACQAWVVSDLQIELDPG